MRERIASCALDSDSIYVWLLQLLDDDTLLHAALHPDLGTIKVQLCRVTGFQTHGQALQLSRPSRPSHIVHEKTKKLGGHCVT